MTNAKSILVELANLAKVLAIIFSTIAILFVIVPLAYVGGNTFAFVKDWQELYDILWIIVSISVFLIIWVWFVATFETRLIK